MCSNGGLQMPSSDLHQWLFPHMILDNPEMTATLDTLTAICKKRAGQPEQPHKTMQNLEGH